MDPRGDFHTVYTGSVNVSNSGIVYSSGDQDINNANVKRRQQRPSMEIYRPPGRRNLSEIEQSFHEQLMEEEANNNNNNNNRNPDSTNKSSRFKPSSYHKKSDIASRYANASTNSTGRNYDNGYSEYACDQSITSEQVDYIMSDTTSSSSLSPRSAASGPDGSQQYGNSIRKHERAHTSPMAAAIAGPDVAGEKQRQFRRGGSYREATGKQQPRVFNNKTNVRHSQEITPNMLDAYVARELYGSASVNNNWSTMPTQKVAPKSMFNAPPVTTSKSTDALHRSEPSGLNRRSKSPAPSSTGSRAKSPGSSSLFSGPIVKRLTAKQITELTAYIETLHLSNEPLVQRYKNYGYDSQHDAKQFAQLLVCQCIEKKKSSKIIAKIACILVQGPNGASFHEGLLSATRQYFDCRLQLRVEHFQFWLNFVTLLTDLFPVVGYISNGGLVTLMFETYSFMLKPPVLEHLKMEELELLISCLLNIGYDLEREVPVDVSHLRTSLRDAFVGAVEPWTRKMLLLLVELSASGWKLPEEASEYYFQATSFT